MWNSIVSVPDRCLIFVSLFIHVSYFSLVNCRYWISNTTSFFILLFINMCAKRNMDTFETSFFTDVDETICGGSIVLDAKILSFVKHKSSRILPNSSEFERQTVSEGCL